MNFFNFLLKKNLANQYKGQLGKRPTGSTKQVNINIISLKSKLNAEFMNNFFLKENNLQTFETEV